MQAVVKRIVLVLCMLAVVTAQLFNAAFAMQMNHNGSVSDQLDFPHAAHGGVKAPELKHSPDHLSHSVDQSLQYISEYLGSDTNSSCCDQVLTESMPHCTDMETNSGGCDDHAGCAQSHCVSSVGCGLSQYILDVDPLTSISSIVNTLLLSQSSVSLYRPPIFR
ncbi:MAG: hypothetical protein KBT66_02480 [Amphritea sp.]|nr:hypothetical protein [Amphritea sp.]